MQALGILTAQTPSKVKSSSGFFSAIKKSPFGLKTYALISILLWCFQLYPQVCPSFGFALVYELIITQIQIWRIFVSLFYSDSFLGIFGIVFNLFLIMQILATQERAFSTIYVLVNVYLSMLIINVLYLMFAALFSLLFHFTSFQIINYGTSISGGWWAMAFYQVYRDSAKAPHIKIKFFQLPCVFQNRFFPWLIAVIFLLSTRDVLGFLSSLLLAHIEGYVIKDNLVKLPFTVYKMLQLILPKFMKQRTDIFSVQKTQHMLKYNCFGYQQPQSYFQRQNIFASSQNQGQGVVIDGQIVSESQITTTSNSQKDFWIKKQEQIDKIERQFQYQVQSQKHAKQFSQKYNSGNENSEKQNGKQDTDENEKRRSFWAKRQQQLERQAQAKQKQNIQSNIREKKKEFEDSEQNNIMMGINDELQ